MIRRVYWRLIAKGLKDMINITRQVKIKVSSWLTEKSHYKYRKQYLDLNVGIKKKKKKMEISSLLIVIEKIFSRPKSRTFFKGSCKFDFMKKLSVISNISCKKQSNLLLHLWLGARSIPPTFENKLRCYKQRFGKIAGGEHSCIR